jgi:hypothetical protein
LNANIREQALQEIKRADGKAMSLITALTIIMMAVAALVEVDELDVPTAAMIGLGAAALMLLASVILAAAVIMPRLNGRPQPGTWLYVAKYGAEAVHDSPTDDNTAHDAATLARLALAKYRALRAAVGLLVAAFITTTIAIAIIVLT